VPDDDLASSVTELRTRLERGDLAHHVPIQLDAALEVVDVDKAARSMIADFEHYGSMPDGERRFPHHLARQRELARQLRLLHDRLNGVPWDPAELARPRTF
jgi:hypothetical protein